MSQPTPQNNIDLDVLSDFITSHGFGAPTQEGIELAQGLMAEGDDLAAAAAEVASRGFTDDNEPDSDSPTQ